MFIIQLEGTTMLEYLKNSFSRFTSDVSTDRLIGSNSCLS